MLKCVLFLSRFCLISVCGAWCSFVLKMSVRSNTEKKENEKARQMFKLLKAFVKEKLSGELTGDEALHLIEAQKSLKVLGKRIAKEPVDGKVTDSFKLAVRNFAKEFGMFHFLLSMWYFP